MEIADPQPESGVAFLLVQLGFHVARLFGERLEPLGLEQRQAGMLVRLAENDGKSQQAIAELMGVNPTRMVFLTDELEELGLVERRRNPADRRSHALYLTEAGTAMLARVREVTQAHEAAVTASLSAAERDQLTTLLRRLAVDQRLAGRGLPGMPPSPRAVLARASDPPEPPGGPKASRLRRVAFGHVGPGERPPEPPGGPKAPVTPSRRPGRYPTGRRRAD